MIFLLNNMTTLQDLATSAWWNIDNACNQLATHLMHIQNRCNYVFLPITQGLSKHICYLHYVYIVCGNNRFKNSRVHLTENFFGPHKMSCKLFDMKISSLVVC